MSITRKILGYYLWFLGHFLIVISIFIILFSIIHLFQGENSNLGAAITGTVIVIVICVGLVFLSLKLIRLKPSYPRFLNKISLEEPLDKIIKDFEEKKEFFPVKEKAIIKFGTRCYKHKLNTFLEDLHLTNEEINELEKIASYFNIPDKKIISVKKRCRKRAINSLVKEIYFNNIHANKEQERLSSISAYLGLPESYVKKIAKNYEVRLSKRIYEEMPLEISLDKIIKDFEEKKKSFPIKEKAVMKFGVRCYKHKLNTFLEDLHLTNEEINELEKIASYFNIPDKKIISVKKRYRKTSINSLVREVYSDNIYTDEEQEQLNRLSTYLGLPESYTKKIVKNHAMKLYKKALNSAAEDERISDEEVKHLDTLLVALKLKSSDIPDKKKETYYRYRLLYDIETNGNLPLVPCIMPLHKYEECHFEETVYRKITKTIRKGYKEVA